MTPKTTPCPKCDGRGVIPQYNHIDDGTCYTCKGRGRVKASQKIRGTGGRVMPPQKLLAGDRVRVTQKHLSGMGSRRYWEGTEGVVRKIEPGFVDWKVTVLWGRPINRETAFGQSELEKT